MGAHENADFESEEVAEWHAHASAAKPFEALGSTEHTAAGSVLVADRDDATGSSVSGILRWAGYMSVQVTDGEAALGVLRTLRFDAMVLDSDLPPRDGVALLSALSMPPRVVLVSPTELDEETRETVGWKILRNLVKPFSPQHLLDAVADAVSKKPRIAAGLQSVASTR